MIVNCVSDCIKFFILDIYFYVWEADAHLSNNKTEEKLILFHKSIFNWIFSLKSDMNK